MNKKNQCLRCLHNFSSPQRLRSHLSRLTYCEPDFIELNSGGESVIILSAKKTKKFFCEYCDFGFTRKDSLIKHQKNACKAKTNEKNNFVPPMSNTNSDVCSPQEFQKIKEQLTQTIEEQMTQKIADLKHEIREDLINQMKESSPQIINNNLQIVCVGNKDNYLDMLSTEWGNFDKALEYIAGCALSNLVGDCKLIELIYGSKNSNDLNSMRFIDKSLTKIEYFNELKEKVIDNRESFGKKLANNLQNSYLKGVNHLINETLDSNGCPNKLLEEYDIQLWNQHIYQLSDICYHKKIIAHLNILCK